MRAPTLTQKRARALRRDMTLPEIVLWRELKARKLDGLQFRKQHPVGAYVLDFYCSAAGLAADECEAAEIKRILKRPIEDARQRYDAKARAGF